MMGRILWFLYGAVAYVAFLVAILYAIGFVTGLLVPKTIDSGTPGPTAESILINVLLLGLFAVQHTIMARPAFKLWWTQVIPIPVERSTFVLLASLILLLTFWQWRPLPDIVWNVEQPALAWVLLNISFGGWALVFYATFAIDHFDLFGLRQVLFHLMGREYHHPPFVEAAVYRWIRHPLMAGFLIAFWFTPTMTEGHLLFAGVTTLYVFLGIHLEERDLRKILGSPYEAYLRRTSMILPLRRASPSGGTARSEGEDGVHQSEKSG